MLVKYPGNKLWLIFQPVYISVFQIASSNFKQFYFMFVNQIKIMSLLFEPIKIREVEFKEQDSGVAYVRIFKH